MPITERLDRGTDALAWKGSIPLHYEYTAGVAGERFMRGLMGGKILAGYCEACGTASLPARMYCVECYSGTSSFVKVGPVGVVRALARGDTERFAFVEFPGTKGGVLHRLIGPGRVGSRVKARFRPRRARTGAISDILGFERAT